jgi:DNA uptake protein ComE-like DNA-binding protein
VLQATGQLPPARSSEKSSETSSETSNSSLQNPEPALPTNWFLDVNRGSQDQWRELPGCTDDMADLLVRLQRGGVQFAAADDLFRLLDLPSDLAQLWAPHLLFHWYGDAPLQPVDTCIDLNNASSGELTTLAWPEQRIHGLLRERRLRGFRDLADLQERLCLPASTVESLIGRVSFGQRRAGPSLPPRG